MSKSSMSKIRRSNKSDAIAPAADPAFAPVRAVVCASATAVGLLGPLLYG